MKSQDLAQFNLPDTPGVYFFLGAPKRSEDGSDNREILYIGKATSLLSRVKSYFSKDLIVTRGVHILDMVAKAETVTFQQTDSVLEALILEANLIKKHQPYYNSKEKDDKSFNYVVITKEDIPRVFTERGKNIDLKKKTVGDLKLRAIYGPFPSGSALRDALRIIRRIFPFADKTSLGKDKEEFYRQLALMPDTRDSQLKQAYMQNVRNIELFFSGKKQMIVKSLMKDMMAAAKRKEFERAGELKRQLFALEHIHDVALIKSDSENGERGFRIEAYDISHQSGKQMVGVMTVTLSGVTAPSEYRKFIIRGFDSANDPGALKEVIERRLNHPEWPFPDLCVADGNMVQKRVIEEVLKERGLSIPVVGVVKNEKHAPKAVIGDEGVILKNKKAIILANQEAHRFAISFHRASARKNLTGIVFKRRSK